MKKHHKTHTLKPVDMPLYSYWKALYLALFSRRLYVDVAKRWQGFGVIYCLTLLMIVVVPFSVQSMMKLNKEMSGNLLIPFSKIPKLQVVDGAFIFNEKMPYVIKNEEGDAIVIIDTTGQINKITEKYPKLVMLITKHVYYFRSPKLSNLLEGAENQLPIEPYKITEYTMKKTQQGVFDAHAWLKESKLVIMKNLLIAVVYPFVLFSFFGFLLPILIALATMGQVASSLVFKYKIKFKPACRLMMVASTLGVSVFFCLKMAGICSNQSRLFCMTLIFVYFNFGIVSVKRESQYLVQR